MSWVINRWKRTSYYNKNKDRFLILNPFVKINLDNYQIDGFHKNLSCTHDNQPLPRFKKKHTMLYMYLYTDLYKTHIWSIKMKNLHTSNSIKIYIFQLFAISNFPVSFRLFVFLPTGAQRGRPMMKKTMEMARMTRVLWGLRVGYWSMTPVRTVSNMANYRYNQKLNKFIQKLIIWTKKKKRKRKGNRMFIELSK